MAFGLNRISDIDSVLWDFGDGQQSTFLAPTHSFSAAGTYKVTVKIYSINCSGNSIDIISHDLFLTIGRNNFLAEDTTICEFDDYVIEPEINAQSYLWSTGSTAPSVSVSAPGIYWLQVDNDGCISRDSIELTLKDSESVELGEDTSVCITKPILLTAAGTGDRYLWNTGETTRTIKISSPGVYTVEVSNVNKCGASDSVSVEWGDCDLFIPTAFSPNGDGVNDMFGLIQGINAGSFSIKIYNRYGQVIFTSSSQLKKWDGQFKNKPVPVGLYPWVFNYTNKNGYPQTETGTVLLIR